MTGSSYNELLANFNPRIIRSEKEYLDVESIMDPLIAKSNLTEDERDYLSLLSMLLERYDEENDVFPELRGIALIRALLEDMDLRQKDLVCIFKSESIVSEVLNGNRKMTTEHIDGLAKMFQLPHSLFFENGNMVDGALKTIEAHSNGNDKSDSNFADILVTEFNNNDSFVQP